MSIHATDGYNVIVIESNDQTANVMRATAAANAAEDSAEAAELSAESAESYYNSMRAITFSERSYDTIADMLASDITYTTDLQSSVVAGDYIRIRSKGYAYIVIDEGTSTAPYLTTADGVKLLPVPKDGFVSVEQCNIPTTGDQTASLQAWLDWAFDDARKYGVDGGGNTYTGSKLTLTDVDAKLRNFGFNSNKTTPNGGFKDDWCLKISSPKVATIDVAADYYSGQRKIVLDDVSGLSVGQLLKIRTTRLIRSDHRGQWQEGMMNRILEIDAATDTVLLDEPIAYSGRANSFVTGEIQSVAGDRYSVEVDNLLGSESRDRECLLTITSGAAAGEDRYIIETTGNFARHMGGDPGQFEEYDHDPWPAGVQAGDTYRWEWKSYVEVYNPLTVEMENVHFEREQKNDFDTADPGFGGVLIEGTFNARIVDCSATGFNSFGIAMKEAVRPIIRRWRGIGCNQKGKGYSISFEIVTNGIVDDCFSLNCRAGFDASGAGGYTVNAVVNNRAIGGGETHDGDEFYPDGTVGCRATGSHGSGHNTIYDSCVGENTANGMNIRGVGEKAYNYTHRGACESGINIAFGTGFQCDGFNYDDMFTEDARDADERSQFGGIAGKGLREVLRMDIGGPNTNHVKTLIRNVRAKSVYGSGVFFDGDAEPMENLVLSDWDLTVTNEGTAETVFEFLTGNGDWLLGDGCSFDNVRATNGAGSTFTAMDFLAVPGSGDIATGSYVIMDDKFYFRVAADGVVNLPFGGLQAIVNLRNARVGDRPYAIGLMIENQNATPVSAGTVRDVEVLAALQTDGSNVTADSVALVLDEDAKVLQIASNMSIDNTFVLSVT